MILQLS